MENNNQNTPDITSEETQKKNEATEQIPIKSGPSTGEKIAKTTGKVLKEGVKITGEVAAVGVKASGGLFGLVAANLKMIAIAMAVSAAVAAAGFIVKAIIDANKIKILDTATVVTEIKKISELTTYTYIDELIIHEKKTEEKEAKSHIFGIGKKDAPDTLRSEIVMIVRGVTRAGYDLGKLTENDLKISGDTISVNLPVVEIFDVIVNPSDTEMFVEEGKWSHEEITVMQVNCRNQMHQNALDRGVLKKADEVGRKKVENLFKALGFKVVAVTAVEVPEVKVIAPEVSATVEDESVENMDTTAVL